MEYYLDGTEIRDKAEFYDAVAAALGFPDWFGHNLDALADCLRDLSWLPGRASTCSCGPRPTCSRTPTPRATGRSPTCWPT